MKGQRHLADSRRSAATACPSATVDSCSWFRTVLSMASDSVSCDCRTRTAKDAWLPELVSCVTWKWEHSGAVSLSAESPVAAPGRHLYRSGEWMKHPRGWQRWHGASTRALHRGRPSSQQQQDFLDAYEILIFMPALPAAAVCVVCCVRIC